MHPLRVGLVVAVAVASMVQAGCDHGPKYGPPDKVTKFGDNQIAPAGSAVEVDPGIVVLDLDGRGVPGVPVIFMITGGGGSIDSASGTTDRTGTAKVGSWKLGTTLGPNTMTVSGDFPGSPFTFTAAATSGPTASIAKVGLDPSSGPAGGNIDSVAVRVIDQFGNPVSGQAILFSVTAGGGNVSPASRVTLADGRAATRWTLGPTIDTPNAMTASTPAGAFSVSFSTVSTRPVSSVRIAQHVMVVDSLGSITPVVAAFDVAGAAVPDAAISLATRNPSVASAGAASVTGLRTGQTFLVATSSDNLQARDSTLVIVGNIGAPVVTLGVPRFDLRSDTTFTASLVVDMRSAAMLGAATLHVTWDPATLVFVSDQAGTANVLAISNTASATTGAMTIAVASGDGVGGVVEVRKLTFKAGTTTGKSGLLAVNLIDLSAAGTFANLLPLAVSGSYPMRIR